MIGKTISHYKILENLGAGGMGVVYKAQDTKLDRFVALKFLPPHLSQDEENKKRFIHEAKAASALDHPNICTIYEIDETADGQMFIAMACYEGESLKEKIECGPLPLHEAIDIAIQVVQGLAKAHSKEIVHRDIKPANILVTKDGVVKIVDFGLAKLAGQTKLTEEGTTLGTVAYMSPEQAQGTVVDHRTDVWALGAVLFEMISGQQPFHGEYEQAVMYSIMNEDLQPLTGLRTGVPMEMERLVNKALAKNADERYQHVDEMIVDLNQVEKSLKSGKTAAISSPRASRIGTRLLFYAAASLLILFLLLKLFLPTARNEVIDSIAVLPLDNLSGDPEQDYFVEGMHEALISDLSKIAALKVISRTSMMRYKETDKPMPEIARDLDVDALVEGSVLRVGDQVRITAQLINGQTDEHLWAGTYDRELRNVLALLSEVAQAIAEEVKIVLTKQEEERLASARPVNPGAHEAYLKGRYYFNKFSPDGNKKAIEYSRLAVEKDPNYALAYVGLANAYGQAAYWGFISPEEAIPKVKAAALKAVEMDDTLGEAHAVLGKTKMYYEWDWVGAERDLKRAIELNPSNSDGRVSYAFDLAAMGRLDEGMAEIKRARVLDPLSLVVNAVFGWHFYAARQYEQATEQWQKTLEINPNSPILHWFLWRAFRQKRMDEEAISECKKTFALWGNPEVVQAIEQGHAEAGYVGAMRRAAEKLVAQSKLRYVPPSEIAMLYAHAQEKDQALQWLEKAYEERDSRLHTVGIDPDWDILRSDPKFQALLKKMGLKK